MTRWIADGEKYALIGLEVKIDPSAVPYRELVPGLWAWTDQRLSIPDHWKEWLGTIRAGDIENCNFVLLTKMQSRAPDVLDAENNILQRQVWGFYMGLLLSSKFTPAHSPICLTGARRDGEVDVRQEMTLDTPAQNIFGGYPELLASEVERAAQLGKNIETLNTTPPAGGAWRIFRALSVYIGARTAPQPLDRLHQYCRCLDALILSEPGKGQSQFKSRTELFIGPRHHDLMGSLYAIRSDVEHLHEHKHLEVFDRAERLELVKKEAMVEHIARKALAHVIGTPMLWPHFGNTAALAPFWGLDRADREALWGASLINPSDALDGFDPTYISDGHLGA